jgi:uncharacterized protein (DUF1501 family)
MCDQHNNDTSKIHGSKLEHGEEAHEQHHRGWSRRDFIRTAGIAGGMSLFLSRVPVTALAHSPLSYALSNTNTDRILVLIRLKGGNDGVNTIIPAYQYGMYQTMRPNIAIPQNQLINLSNELAMPNTMAALQTLWQDGRMKVVNNVGYPDQNLSHFRSGDIWASASDSNVVDDSGWLGRWLNDLYPEFATNPPDVPPAIQIGGGGSITFTNPDEIDMSMIAANPEQLAEIALTGMLYDTQDVPDCYYGEQLTYMRTIANSTFRYAQSIADAYGASTNNGAYESTNNSPLRIDIAEQLAVVARLIKGGLGTRLYMVTVDGFDTHAGQNNVHPSLMYYLAVNVKAFYDDLAAGGVDNDVLCMTHSEFGRRIEQNASQGTDHGAAAPLMMFGSGLNGNGFVGGLPNLQNVDVVGNLQYAVDFRRIYATVLEDWLCIDTALVDQVMGQSFTRLPELGLVCLPTSTSYSNIPSIQHKALYGNGQVIIEYTLPEPMPVTIQVFDILGRPVEQLYKGQQWQGTHQVTFRSNQARLVAGIYVYSIEAGGRVYSQKIRLMH